MPRRVGFLLPAFWGILSLLCYSPSFAQTAPPAPVSELDRIFEAAKALHDKGDNPAAEKLYQSGLEKAQAARDAGQEARFLNKLGIVYDDLGQFDKAEDCFKRGLAIREKLGDPAGIAESLDDYSFLLGEKGQLAKAREFALRGLAIREKLGDPKALTSSYNDTSAIYSMSGLFEEAVTYGLRAKELNTKLGDTEAVIHNLGNLGNAYLNMGKFEEALDCQKRALAFRLQQGNLHDIAVSYNNLGNVYEQLGEYDRALELRTKALAIDEKLGNAYNFAQTLANLGGLYEYVGQYEKAREQTRRALEIQEKQNSAQDVASNLDLLGRIDDDLGQTTRAQEEMTRSLALRETLGNTQDIAYSLSALANFYNRQGRYAKALTLLQRAYLLRQKIGNVPDLAFNLLMMGNAWMGQGQLAKAESAYARALALWKTKGNSLELADGYDSLGVVTARRRQFARAEAYFTAAIRNYEDASQKISDPGQVSALQDKIPHLYAHYADALLQNRRPHEALVMAERGRAQGLARLSAAARVDFAQKLSGEDAKELRQRREAASLARNLWLAVRNRDVPEDIEERRVWQTQLAAAQARNEEAERRLTLVQDSILARNSAYRRLQGRQPVTYAALAQLAKNHPDTLYLEWAIVDAKTILLFALSADAGLKAFRLSLKEKALSEQAADWKRRILSQDAQEPKLARALYDQILGPLERTGLLRPNRYARLVLVAEGPLLDFSFAALRDRKGRRLVERYALSSAVSLGILTWQQDNGRPTGLMLCVADPLGSSKAEFQSASRGGFRPLPYSRREGQAIAGLFAGAVAMMGAQAREETVRQRMGEYAILHFATHGMLDAGSGLRSGLVMAPEAENSAEDGILEAREIAAMRLKARLAVLSACETGQGQQQGGDGLLGLSWAFRAAGCPSVVASQWSVSDAETGALMLAFYKGLKAGRRKDEALRQAMRTIMRERSAPFYWAAFEVIGDSGALALRGDRSLAARSPASVRVDRASRRALY